MGNTLPEALLQTKRFHNFLLAYKIWSVKRLMTVAQIVVNHFPFFSWRSDMIF